MIRSLSAADGSMLAKSIGQRQSSGWVMFELGAAWGQGKLVLPLIVDAEYESLCGPLGEINVTDAASRPKLNVFDGLCEGLNLEGRRAGRATDAIDELVEEASSHLDGDDDEDDDER